MSGYSYDGTLPPPLAGLKVVDLSQFMAAPLPTMMLADMGAEVIKIEPPDGDAMRRTGNVFINGETPFFLSLNRGKKSVVVDVRKPAGREIFMKLAKTADVIVENFRPGVVARLGIDYAAVAAINPQVIYCSTSAFGPTGPYRDKPGIDAVVQAMSGIMSFNGEPDRGPSLVGPPIADFAGGMMTLQAILLALVARERYGVGQKVDACLLNATLYAMIPREQDYFATGKPLERMGSAHRNIAPYAAYETRDGYVYLAILGDPQFQKLCRVLEREELVDDPRFRTNTDRVTHRAELDAILEPIMRQETTAEWMKRLDAGDVLAGPVNDFDQVYSDPQVAENNMVVKMMHPAAGEIRQLGVPVTLSKTPGQLKSPPPLLGQHTVEVLTSLGYTEEDLVVLRQDGTILG